MGGQHVGHGRSGARLASPSLTPELAQGPAPALGGEVPAFREQQQNPTWTEVGRHALDLVQALLAVRAVKHGVGEAMADQVHARVKRQGVSEHHTGKTAVAGLQQVDDENRVPWARVTAEAEQRTVAFE